MKERIKGGKAAGMSPKDFNAKQLAAGVRVELEHTDSRKVAREIAMDHLAEDPGYYRKLAEIHTHNAKRRAEPKTKNKRTVRNVTRGLTRSSVGKGRISDALNSTKVAAALRGLMR